MFHYSQNDLLEVVFISLRNDYVCMTRYIYVLESQNRVGAIIRRNVLIVFTDCESATDYTTVFPPATFHVNEENCQLFTAHLATSCKCFIAIRIPLVFLHNIWNVTLSSKTSCSFTGCLRFIF